MVGAAAADKERLRTGASRGTYTGCWGKEQRPDGTPADCGTDQHRPAGFGTYYCCHKPCIRSFFAAAAGALVVSCASARS